MPKYKIPFTDLEINKFNLVENKNIRKSLMSIYMYLLKLTETRNKEYEEVGLLHLVEDTTKLKISFRQFLKKYNRSHSKVSICTLKDRMDTLETLKLIKIDKNLKTNIYSFYRYFSDGDNNNNDKDNNKKAAEHIDNTKNDDVSKEYKDLNTESIIDLDSNSSYENKTTVDNFDMQKYINSEEKVSRWDYINNLLKEAFKSLKVRSSWIKGTVISKLFKYYKNITKKYAMTYVCRTIEDARKQYYANYAKYVLEENAKIDSFINYKQRDYTQEQLNSMELALRGY